MKNRKFAILFITGILLATTGPVLATRLHLPDVLAGLICGFGIGLMLTFLIKMAKTKSKWRGKEFTE